MKRILFVDDEPNVLQGLKRMLRSMRKEWDMHFAEGGQQALSKLAEQPFDVVVTDMRMPGMDGAQLLTEVTRLYPNTVRIVLSGQSDKEAIFKAVGKTHQYLSKPCDPEILRQTVARACALRDLLTDEKIESIASQIDKMPSLPEIYLELVEELKEESPSLPHIARLISQDVAMTAKILQLVNSAFFGLRRRITTVDQAVNYLGLENVSSLVLAANVFGQFSDKIAIKGFSIESLWGHSGKVGRFAQKIAAVEHVSSECSDDAVTAGLLHDCGKLIFAANMPEEYAQALDQVRQGVPPMEAEVACIGATHCAMGAYVLGVWGLPDTIVEAVAFHSDPAACPTSGVTPLTLVYAANHFANERPVDALDADYLGRAGAAKTAAQWLEALQH